MDRIARIVVPGYPHRPWMTENLLVNLEFSLKVIQTENCPKNKKEKIIK